MAEQQVSYHFPRPVDEGARDELRKALTFYYGHATIEPGDPGILVTVAAGLSGKELGEVVRHFLRGHREVPVKVVAEHARPEVALTVPHDDRIELGPGVYLQGPDWFGTMEATRKLVRDFLGRTFDTPQLYGSALIPRDVLVRAGYYRKFPNLVSSVSRIRADYWDGVAVAGLRDGQTDALSSFYVPSEQVLNPVTCYHVYARAEQLMAAHGTGLFAIEGPVFRHESHNHTGTRLAEFSMRELVGLGTHAEVAAYFERFLDAYVALFAQLGLPHRIVSASDAFFGGDPSITRDAQLLSGGKFEVRVPVAGGELSVASVNAHGEVFAEAFGLRAGGRVEATCCAGIGLERLAYALKAYDLV